MPLFLVGGPSFDALMACLVIVVVLVSYLVFYLVFFELRGVKLVEVVEAL